MARAKTKSPNTSIRTGRARVVAAFFRGFYSRVMHAQSREFYTIVSVTLLIACIGVLMVLSASFVDAMKTFDNVFAVWEKQLLFAVAGIFLMGVASTLQAETVRKLGGLVGVLGLFAQVLVLVSPLGVSINGNRNWLSLGFFNIQPSEFLKIAMILIVASWVNSRQNELDDVVNTWGKLALLVSVAFLAVFMGRDLGTVIIMVMVFLGMAYLAGLPKMIWGLVLVGSAIAVPILMTTSESRWGRIMAWLNPNAPDPNDYNWQSVHGMWAIAAGGIGGVGLGQSKLKWSWIPEAENDFIFAIIAEELGMIGALVLIGLFVYLAVLLMRVAARTNNEFARLTVIGIMLWITIQAMVNIAVVLRLLPVLGVPLPLVSSGGSSMVACLIAIGIVLSIERDNHERLGARRVR